jgi:hypothetical protein
MWFNVTPQRRSLVGALRLQGLLWSSQLRNMLMRKYSVDSQLI